MLNPLNSQLDHLVIAAATLEQGVAWCEATLGASPGPGGQHVLMSTHNRLMKIESAGFPGVYLEIIAIDPDAPAPGRVRWFGLDDPELQARIALQPQLVHGVARTDHLDLLRVGLVKAGEQPGVPVAARRETPQGLLSWQILVRDDGVLPCGGALPTLIQWQGLHPTARMAASPVALQRLVLRGLPSKAQSALQLQGVDFDDSPGPALTATLDTPRGPITLSSPAP
jgi:Glyoxalase-like domain